MFRHLAFATVLFALFVPRADAQVAPFKSWEKLTSANGFAPVVFDASTRRVVSFRENMYRFPEPGKETRELAYDLYLGVRNQGTSHWLTGTAITELTYEGGTNIIRFVQDEPGLRITTHVFSPFTVDARVFFVIATIENIGAETRDVALFSIHNFHLGGGPDGTRGERIRWDATLGAFLESATNADGARGTLLVKPLTPHTHRAASPSNPYPIVNQGGLLPDTDDSGAIDDAVSGFQFDVAGRNTFAAGDRASIAFAVGYARDGDTNALANAIAGRVQGKTPEQILEGERTAWRNWHAAGAWPNTVNAEEKALAEQSLAFLRMGQVREPGAPFGGILASLAPGIWDISWVRDGMFAVDALTELAHYDEARAGLEFMIRGPHGDYQSYVGMPYGLSITRYFGNAREESDSNENGPNIELDGFGMFLEGAARYVAKSGDTAFFDRHRSHIDAKIADVLAAFRDVSTGLVAAESSIWETHWDNGGRQRWTYTNGMAVRGLEAWAKTIRTRAGSTDAAAERYDARAREIYAAMLAHLVDDTGAFAASVEQLATGRLHSDGQTAMILDRDRFDASSRVGLNTLDMLRRTLFLPRTGHGYKRNDDGGEYDEREWVVVDLAISRALRIANRTQDANALLDWVTALGIANYSIVPELLDQTTARYVGAIPMIGFGAGAYLIALAERSGTSSMMPVPPPDAGVGSPDATVRVDAGNDSGVTMDDEDAGSSATDATTMVTTVPPKDDGCTCVRGRDRLASAGGPASPDRDSMFGDRARGLDVLALLVIFGLLRRIAPPRPSRRGTLRVV